MGTLPATGTTISMGRTGAAYYNGTPTTNVSIGNIGATRSLNPQIGRGNITTNFSSIFGGRTTPYTY